MSLPCPRDEAELDARLAEPGIQTVAALRRCPGDLVILGAGGKIGPTLTAMAVTAANRADGPGGRRVIAVSRFSSSLVERRVQACGAHTIRCDLLDPASVAALPEGPNVVFLAGQKFGTVDAPERTWMINVVVPALVALRYSSSRVVAFSTGNVYPLSPVGGGGSRETDAPAPIGEYAWSCLGRERVFQDAATRGALVALLRLNYANDLRYGVLTDLALRVWRGEPIPLGMGAVNLIWQGDANRIALEMLPHAASPAFVVNVTGPDAPSVRALGEGLGRRLGRRPLFEGAEGTDALLSDTARLAATVRPPETTLDTMLDWVAEWVRDGRPVLGRPTHFDVRDGTF